MTTPQRRFEVGQRVGEWTLESYRPAHFKVKAKWFCTCSCGSTRWVMADNLANGSSTSCGHGTKRRRPSEDTPRINSVFALGKMP